MLTRTPKQGYLAACGALEARRPAALRGSDSDSRRFVSWARRTARRRSPLVRETAGLIEGARFEIIPGAGHVPNIERPEAFAALVARHAERATANPDSRSLEAAIAHARKAMRRPLRVGARESIDTRRFRRVRPRTGAPEVFWMSQPVSREAAPPSTYQAEGGASRPLERQLLDSRARLDRRRLRRHRNEPALRAADGARPAEGLRRGPADVIGVVSLIIWALLIVVTAKYVLFLMQADNKGEGGILSLKALAQRALGQRTTIAFLLGVAGIGAVFRRRDHHAGDFRSLRARGTEAGRRRSRALCPARDNRHSGAPLHRPEPRHGGRRGLLRTDHGGRSSWSMPCSACFTSPTPGASWRR